MAGDLYDFHSHILPGMDDGYRDTQTALEALKRSYAQGVRYMVATPHYYADEPVDRFLQRRQKAYAELRSAMEKAEGPFPEICLGAEVAYYPNISCLEDIQRLCIGNSRYLMLELPMRSWGTEVLRDVQSICNAGEVIPIIAHIERYISFQSRETVARIFGLELLLQLSAEFITDRRTRFAARRMLKMNPAFLLGTDCHDLDDRRPNMGEAIAVLRGHHMERAVDRAMALSEEIWSEAVG